MSTEGQYQAYHDAADEQEDFITRTIAQVDTYLAQEQREVLNQLIDEERAREWDEWLSRYCQVHDVELVNGQCAACISEEQEELRNDH
jgi:hypothetical protein